MVIRQESFYVVRIMSNGTIYDARSVANWFIQRAAKDGRVLSIMSLLKLIYIAHGWHLEINKGKPLIANRIEAWQYGPVIPEVYNTFRPQGVDVGAPVAGWPEVADPFDQVLLEEVYTIYGKMSPFTLSDLTHVAGGPWDTASKWGNYSQIPNELIHAHYVLKRQEAAARQEDATA